MVLKTINNTAARARHIHKGDKTHHQDQSITLHSLSITKTINTTPTASTPPDLSFKLLIIIFGFNRLFTYSTPKRTHLY